MKSGCSMFMVFRKKEKKRKWIETYILFINLSSNQWFSGLILL